MASHELCLLFSRLLSTSSTQKIARRHDLNKLRRLSGEPHANDTQEGVVIGCLKERRHRRDRKVHRYSYKGQRTTGRELQAKDKQRAQSVDLVSKTTQRYV